MSLGHSRTNPIPFSQLAKLIALSSGSTQQDKFFSFLDRHATFTPGTYISSLPHISENNLIWDRWSPILHPLQFNLEYQWESGMDFNKFLDFKKLIQTDPTNFPFFWIVDDVHSNRKPLKIMVCSIANCNIVLHSQIKKKSFWQRLRNFFRASKSPTPEIKNILTFLNEDHSHFIACSKVNPSNIQFNFITGTIIDSELFEDVTSDTNFYYLNTSQAFGVTISASFSNGNGKQAHLDLLEKNTFAGIENGRMGIELAKLLTKALKIPYLNLYDAAHTDCSVAIKSTFAAGPKELLLTELFLLIEGKSYYGRHGFELVKLINMSDDENLKYQRSVKSFRNFQRAPATKFLNELVKCQNYYLKNDKSEWGFYRQSNATVIEALIKVYSKKIATNGENLTFSELLRTCSLDKDCVFLSALVKVMNDKNVLNEAALIVSPKWLFRYLLIFQYLIEVNNNSEYVWFAGLFNRSQKMEIISERASE